MGDRSDARDIPMQTLTHSKARRRNDRTNSKECRRSTGLLIRRLPFRRPVQEVANDTPPAEPGYITAGQLNDNDVADQTIRQVKLSDCATGIIITIYMLVVKCKDWYPVDVSSRGCILCNHSIRILSHAFLINSTMATFGRNKGSQCPLCGN